MKKLNNKVRLKSGQNISVEVFAQDIMQYIKKKDWNQIKSKLKECDLIPYSDIRIIELFLRSSRAAQINIVDIFLKLGVDINSSLNGHSALSLAIELANVKMVKALIDRGIDVNLRPGYVNRKEKSALPLSSAVLEVTEADDARVRKSMLQIVQCLLEAGAKIPDQKEEPLFDIALQMNCPELRGILTNSKSKLRKNEQNSLSIPSKNMKQNSLILPLIGKYCIDIDATISFLSQKKESQNISKPNKKDILTLFHSNARQLQKIQLEITKTEFILSSPDGIEKYKVSCKKSNGKLVLVVNWGIPTLFHVLQLEEHFYHFKNECNTLSEVIWKKYE